MVRWLTIPHFLGILFLCVGILPSETGGAEFTSADAILPDTTKFFVSIDDVEELLEKWRRTQAGRLANQPAVQPFLDDLTQQFQANMSLLRRLGSDWSEFRHLKIQGIHWAIVQPGHDPEQVAVALVGNVSAGKEGRAVLKQLLALLSARGATVTNGSLDGQSIQIARWPKQGQYDRPHDAYFQAAGNSIFASDNAEVLTAMIGRRTAETGSLRQSRPYAEIKQRCTLSNLDQPDLSWFAEPFGFAETLRASNGGRRKRGRDLLKVLPRQGFDAIQGMGGVLRLNYEEFDNLSQAYIYAPAAPGKPASERGDRFTKAARMLSFPNHDDATPLNWIPAEVGSYVTLRCRLGEAFEHSKSLVDDLAVQPVFEEVLKSIELDPNGPQVNLREAIVRHLGQRVVVLTEPNAATNAAGQPQGGRMAGIAIELTNSRAVDKSLAKIMAPDPAARRVDHQGNTLWVMTAAAADESGQDAPGAFDSFATPEDDFAEDGVQLFPNRIFFVAHGHLMITTTEALAKRLLEKAPPAKSLARSARYQRVRATLADMGAGPGCFRFFVRTSKLVESEYRQLRLAERFDLFDNFGLLMEKVWVSGEKLPPYEQVATDLGDSGIYVCSENDGWRIVGFLLKNETGE